jgi:hypothetical protein
MQVVEGASMSEAGRGLADRERARELAAAFAAAEGIDLDVRLDAAVPDRATADRNFRMLKEAFPDVPSAYRPSGSVPLSGLLFMAAGALLTVPVGLLAGGLLAAFAALLLLVDFQQAKGKARLAPLLGIVALAFVVPVAGTLSAVCTTYFCRPAKVRSSFIAMLFAVTACLLTALTAWSLFEAYGRGYFNGRFQAKPGELDTVYVVVAGVGTVLAAVVSAYLAFAAVYAEKFCEDCGRYLEGSPLPSLRLGGTLALTRALEDGNLRAAAGLLDGPGGTEGKPQLFLCPDCGRGYLEVNVHYKAAWAGGEEKKEKEEEWRAVSLPLDSAEADLFRLYRDGPGAPADTEQPQESPGVP